MKNWTQEEDQRLNEFYQQTPSFKKWKQISQKFSHLGITKSAYQCRERYINKLDPAFSSKKWQYSEVELLFKSYAQHGSKWKVIQKELPSRTQTDLKNKFYSFLRSFLLKSLRACGTGNCKVISGIRSQDIKCIYESKNQFQFLKSNQILELIELIGFDLDKQKIHVLVKSYCSVLRQVQQVLQKNSADGEQEQQSRKSEELKWDPENEENQIVGVRNTGKLNSQEELVGTRLKGQNSSPRQLPKQRQDLRTRQSQFPLSQMSWADNEACSQAQNYHSSLLSIPAFWVQYYPLEWREGSCLCPPTTARFLEFKNTGYFKD